MSDSEYVVWGIPQGMVEEAILVSRYPGTTRPITNPRMAAKIAE